MTAKKIIREPIVTTDPETSTEDLLQVSAEPQFMLITPEDFQDKIRSLRERATIRNDKGDNVDFVDEAKEDFVAAFQEGYPILEKTLNSLYELGTFLHGVREKLKPHKLYHAWLDYAGLPRGTAQTYVQAYDRYHERLSDFAALGIKKLLIASRLPDCIQYVEQNKELIASQTTEELEKQVKELRQPKEVKETKVGRKPKYFSIGSYRIRPSIDGSKVTVEGMTKDEQEEFIAAIKKLLSRKKG